MLYHGTSEKAWETIRTSGLVPGGGKGADVWAATAPENALNRAFFGLPQHARKEIFLAHTPAVAKRYAEYAAEVNNSKPVVLEVDMSPEGLSRDPEDSGEYMFDGVVPPEKLKIHVVRPRVRKAGA